MFSVSIVHFHDPVCNFFFFLTLSAFKVCCLYCHLKLIFDSIGLSSQRVEEGLMFTEH